MGLEIAEQLGGELPDVILYPTGGGTGLIGIPKAFEELRAAGRLDPGRPLPRVAIRRATGAPCSSSISSPPPPTSMRR